jgi:D-tyrosyl-tRNA(Tyr) deacylase
MIAVVQRVKEAKVVVEGETVGAIGEGLLVLAAVQRDDTDADSNWIARKLVGLRIFRSGEKHFDQDVQQINGGLLLVSNFTVAANATKGRRPSLDNAAPPAEAEGMFTKFVDAVRAAAGSVKVETGRFGASMEVSLVNDGPATFILDSAEAT